MSNIKYTPDHEWVATEGDGSLTIGITSFAQEQLGDIVFVQLPAVGEHFDAGAEAVVIESVKAAADVKMPVAGEVLAVNTALADTPELVNSDPMSAGWFLKVRPDAPEDVAALLDEASYNELIDA
jgi:glycine cleavage system H protein